MKGRKLRKKIKNFVLRTITTIASAGVVLSAGCADSPNSNVPLIICIVCLAWIVLFCYANGYFNYDRRMR